MGQRQNGMCKVKVSEVISGFSLIKAASASVWESSTKQRLLVVLLVLVNSLKWLKNEDKYVIRFDIELQVRSHVQSVSYTEQQSGSKVLVKKGLTLKGGAVFDG